MIQKITLDMLTQDSVSVKIQKFVAVDGQEYPLGNPHRKAYINSEIGRKEVENEVPEPQRSAIFAVWGSEPTIADTVEETE